MTLFSAGLFLILGGGLAALVLAPRSQTGDRVFRLAVAAGSVLAAWPALLVLGSGARCGPGVDWGWFGLDRLSAWFLIVILLIGAITAWFGASYLAGERGKRSVGWAHLLFAVLLVALCGVVTARTAIAFLTAWEFMAVSAWLLVIFEREKPEAHQAGLIYLVLTHASTLTLFAMFAAWTGGAVGTRFDALAGTPPVGSPGLVLGLALVGFGIKAGMVPVHFWLPGAHAAAPSHVSALLSGVMLKSGIYGLLRVLTLLGAPPPWWGWTVLILGLGSAVLGVLWALAQHDLKRLLAYHSVENIGIILVGVGLGALGMHHDRPVIALLGFGGALLHTLNHGLFKSLLFLGAGVVGRATRTRELDRLGGLARPLPRTAAAFLIGSIAIVGLPPLNGFVSEWLILRGLLESGATEGPLRAASAATAGLALTAALALACFAKLHGTVFLGALRDAGAAAEPQAERGLVAPQVVLAALCVAVGVLPVAVVPVVTRVSGDLIGASGQGQNLAAATAGRTMMTVMALLVLAAAGLVWSARAWRLRRVPVRVAETWACGYPHVTSRMQYTASSFAASLVEAFGALSGSHVVGDREALHVEAADPILDRAGRPLWARVQQTASSLRVLQIGRLSWYLLYVVATLVLLLAYLWVAAR